MATPAQKRLLKDLKNLGQDPPEGITGAPLEDDILRWNAVIFGPKGTPFEDGIFKLTMQFSEEYPNKAPKVKFVTRLFHPNVYADGSICLDILQQKWSPTYNVVGILTSIQSLLNDPNPNSPANAVAAKMFCENKREYERRVRECVEESWNDVSDDDEDDDEEEDDDDADEPEAEEGQLQPEAGSDVADQAGTAAASGSTSSQSADGRPDRAAAKRSALARADGASSDEPDLRSQLGGAAG